jgi:hypothetical protein
MALYQLSLFYPSVKQHVKTLQRIKTDVQSIAGTNWRVLTAGEQICAIGFATDLPPDQIRARLGSFDGIEQFQFLLVEIAKVQSGFLSPDVWQWLSAHSAKR